MEARLRALFSGIDADGNGVLSREELSGKLRADDELQQLMEGAGKAAHYVFEQLDADGDGMITVDEFVQLCASEDDAAMEPTGEESQPIAALEGGVPPPPVGLPIAARPKGAPVMDAEDDDAVTRWEADVRAMAWYLGMNLVLDEAHMEIAEQALSAGLPDGWSEAMDPEGRAYYWRTDDPGAEAQWEHPADASFRRQLLEARAAGRTEESLEAGLTVAEPPMPGMFRPKPGVATVEELAEYLGMDLTADRGLLWIADAALAAGMPEGWSMHETSNGPPFFHNAHFGITQWEHPTDQFFRSMYLSEKAKLETGEEPVVKLARPMPRTMPKDREQEQAPPPEPVKGDRRMRFGGGDAQAAENFSRLRKVSPLGVVEPRRVRPKRRAARKQQPAPTVSTLPGSVAHLHVRIIEAKELRPVDTFGLSDPLVAVSHSGPFGRHEERSPAVRRTLNPTFIGANFTFSVATDVTASSSADEKASGWGAIDITVIDAAPATADVSHIDTILGVVRLELRDLEESANGGFGIQRWLKLEPTEGASWKAQGEVHVMVQVLPNDSSASVLIPAPEVSESADGDEIATEYTETDVRDMAVYLGMNPLTDEHLFWLAEEALCASLPLGWNPVIRDGGDQVVFVDTRTGLESAEHPMDPCFRNIYFREKEAERLFEENEWRAVQAEAELLQRAMLEAEQSEIHAGDGSEPAVEVPVVPISAERDDTWKRIAMVPTDKLIDLVFTTADSNTNGVLSKRELRDSVFGESLATHWSDLDADGDASVTKEEFTGFFTKLEEQLSTDEFTVFVIDLVWQADVDVAEVLPPSKTNAESSDEDLGLANVTADWEDSQIMPSEATSQWQAERMQETGEHLPPEPISAVAVEYMAKYFGVDMTIESELVSLVRQAVCAALPDNIVEQKDPETGATVWLDTMTNETKATHPFESSTKNRLPDLRKEIEDMRQRRADRLATVSKLDQAGVELPAEAMVAYQRVVGLVDLLGPEPGSDEAPDWKSWPRRIAGTHPQAWVALVQPHGASYYQRFGVDSDGTTASSPYDWASLEEITMQLHWYYRLHDTDSAAGTEAREKIVRKNAKKVHRASPLSSYDPAKKLEMPPSESGAHNWSRKAQAPSQRTGELAAPKHEAIPRSERSYYSTEPSTRAERQKSKQKTHARCVWMHRSSDKDVDSWLQQSVRQGHFHVDTPLLDKGKYAKYIERLQTRLTRDEMQYGSGDPRVEQGAYVLCMMCNLLGQREMALGNHIPALQLFKQAEQASDPAIGYPFPARQQCRAWTLDSLAYYYEKRGKHRGAHSYLQKAFQALAASDDGQLESSPFRGVDILLHTGYVAAKMFNYEQSAMSSRAAVLALHSLAADNSPASTPDAIRTHLRMLSVAYNNLAVGLFGMGLASDLPALQLLIDRAAATADLAAAAPGRDLVNSHAPLIRDNAAVFAMKGGRPTRASPSAPAKRFGSRYAQGNHKGDGFGVGSKLRPWTPSSSRGP